MLISKSSFLHLRFPFSFFLMPVFCFGLAISQSENYLHIFLIFFILHLLVYPASNGYNSFFDKDEESIGGLEKPPPVSQELWNISIFLDALGVLLALWISWYFAIGILIYGLVSKAYSYDKIRLKKMPIIGWLTVAIFQGFFTFMIVVQGLENTDLGFWANNQIWQAGALSSILLLGSYPMTQVYQHEEDAKRGDKTISRVLGIRGTFLFTMFTFLLAGLAYVLYFWHYYDLQIALIFQLSLLPVIIYFLAWFGQVWKDKTKANFKATMRLNLLSALCLNAFFIFFYFYQ